MNHRRWYENFKNTYNYQSSLNYNACSRPCAPAASTECLSAHIGPVKLFSECRAAAEKWRKGLVSLFCKPLFHFHTSLSPLWYFTGLLAPVQVWTQYSYWDHGLHLLDRAALALAPAATASCSNCHNYISFSFLSSFFGLVLTLDAAQAAAHGRDPPPSNLHRNSGSGGPQCAGNGSCATTSAERPIYPTFN